METQPRRPLPPLAATWCLRRRETECLYVTITPSSVARLREAQPERARRTVTRAERILAHEFNLLGSGPFVPADPDRPMRDGYTPIDWYLDPVRRLRFPRGVPYKEWNLYGMRPGNADIKYPWELARCQHWVTLGQAYQLTGDSRFALEIVNELDDFIQANPVGSGINWTCTMDVALRSVSWAIGLELVRTSSIPETFWTRAYTALRDHGVFIRENLENTYEVTSNHFLSNVVGLFFLGAIFAELSEGTEWHVFARTSLEQEMNVQVLPDGADYESSIPYHRLVTELFLGSARLADHLGQPMSSAYRAKLRSMISYFAAVTRPDGLMPQVGDADDGRLHLFDGYGTASPQDGRHLFGPAAAMFDEPRWLELAGSCATWEAAWWGFDVPPSPSPTRPADETSRLFPHAGIAVIRSAARHFLIVTNGIVGTNGFGNHKHNDQLSFEYHDAGVPLIVDPGSYVYTSDPAARNRFRGTASHNTLCVDGIEQNDMRPDWLFRLFERSNAEHISFEDRPDAAEYVGRHHGYERLDQPVMHERTFRFLKTSGTLVIVDRLSGCGEHELRWHFHLAPGVSAERLDDRTVLLTAGTGRWRLTTPPNLEVIIEPASYSPSYGVKVPCLAVDVSIPIALDGTRTYEFVISA